MLTVVPDLSVSLPADGPSSSLIDQIVREGARQMLAAALRAEVAACIGQFAGVRGEDGRRLVARSGSAGPRTVLTSAGAVQVTAPRVNDKRADPESGQRLRFSSASLPPWARRTPQVAEVVPLLYLHGPSSGDFGPALGQFLGTGPGLSSSAVTKLTETWKAEAAAFMTRDLSQADYVYLWVDGIHLGIRLEEGKLCLLVMIGVRADGRKELVALADGYRESAELWADLLRDCARRGMRAPVLAVGDGALVREFAVAYGARFPKAAAKITGDEEELVAFYDYPAGHWVHLRTTNPIESTFATVRLRTKVTKGHGSKAAGLAMAFKLIESAQRRWRMVNAPHLAALVRAGATFVNGKLAERPDDPQPADAAAEAA